MEQARQRCLLGVFAHPDDETSGCAGTLTRYAREGVEVYVVTATRGELGGLGTGDLSIKRKDLPAVRESELRAVLAMDGVNQSRSRDAQLTGSDLLRDRAPARGFDCRQFDSREC